MSDEKCSCHVLKKWAKWGIISDTRVMILAPQKEYDSGELFQMIPIHITHCPNCGGVIPRGYIGEILRQE